MKKIITLFTLLFAMCVFAQSIDTSFDSGTGILGDEYGGYLNATCIQSDNKIIIGGYFEKYNGIARHSIARLNSNGSLDASFNPGTGVDGGVKTISVQSNGKIIIGGTFTSYNGIARKNIARLNIDGSLDMSFNTGTGTDKAVTASAIQPDGKIIIAGNFKNYNGNTVNYIVRLNTDGSLDTSFITSENKEVNTLLLQSDGKIIVGGYFTSYNGAKAAIIRLNPNGTLDSSFDTGMGVDSTALSMSKQLDGKILVGGVFSINNTPSSHLVRLNTDGSLDTSFNYGKGPSDYVWTISVQSDGKIIIGGDFTYYNSVNINRIACLNTDGSLDAGFNTGAGIEISTSSYYISRVSSISVQSDDKIIIGGDFSSYNGVPVKSILRINNTTALGVIENKFEKSIQLYPNPVSDILTIDSQENISPEVEIYDTLGKCVKTTTSFDNRIDVSSLSSGIYILKITDGNNGVYKSKFVKK